MYSRAAAPEESRVIPNEVPRFFFPAAVWRARDAERDLLSMDQTRSSFGGPRRIGETHLYHPETPTRPHRQPAICNPQIESHLSMPPAANLWPSSCKHLPGSLSAPATTACARGRL